MFVDEVVVRNGWRGELGTSHLQTSRDLLVTLLNSGEASTDLVKRLPFPRFRRHVQRSTEVCRGHLPLQTQPSINTFLTSKQTSPTSWRFPSDTVTRSFTLFGTSYPSLGSQLIHTVNTLTKGALIPTPCSRAHRTNDSANDPFVCTLILVRH